MRRDGLGEGGTVKTVRFTEAEIRAVLAAIGRMTDANDRALDEWRLEPIGHHSTWRTLLRAEEKLADAITTNKEEP
jgi:hypothetical protein